MDALFVGQTYIDITLITDELPTGDDKTVADQFAVSFGGNAVTAAFCCAKLGVKTDLLATVADDWLGHMFVDMARRYKVSLHSRKVQNSSLSFIIPKDGQRAIVRCRDARFLHPFPPLSLDGCRAIHLDGHQADAAIHFARAGREAGILTSLDGGGMRENTIELLKFIDVAVVAERLCEQMNFEPHEMLNFLKSRGCAVGAVTRGEKGVIWYERGSGIKTMPALDIPRERVIDTNGAGDIFHGAYIYSALASPEATWEDHFRFARAASAHAIQHLGNEASLPTLAEVTDVLSTIRARA